MKAETLNYKIPGSVRLTGKQMEACYEAWKERWGVNKPPEEMSEEDCLIEAEALGFVELPEGWSCI